MTLSLPCELGVSTRSRVAHIELTVATPRRECIDVCPGASTAVPSRRANGLRALGAAAVTPGVRPVSPVKIPAGVRYLRQRYGLTSSLAAVRTAWATHVAQAGVWRAARCLRDDDLYGPEHALSPMLAAARARAVAAGRVAQHGPGTQPPSPSLPPRAALPHPTLGACPPKDSERPQHAHLPATRTTPRMAGSMASVGRRNDEVKLTVPAACIT
jgi:hypothetical protein